ncbi:MAG: PEP-CTERM sorting domain-containing protein [Chthonomonas sp.]|nr:PEP-CTERM sorting domain-containing protein [Chthonomonas sp.]
MRLALLAAAIGCVSAAHASFDMLLIADATAGVVYRYDGDTGTYLGSFGGGDLVGCTSIAIKQNLGLAFVGLGSAGGYSVYDYNTGNLITSNSFAFVRGIATTNTGVLAATGSTQISLTNGFGTGLPFTNYNGTAGDVFNEVAVDSGQQVVSYSTSMGRISRWSPTGYASPVQTVIDNAYIGMAGCSIQGTKMLSVSSTGVANIKNITALGSAPTAGFGPGTAWTSAIDIEFGHTNVAYGLGKVGTQLRLQKYRQFGVSDYWDSFGASRQLTLPTNAVGMAIVVAPEPGGLALLGLGLVVIIRRRR